jgi:hypothetical protein
MGLRAGIVEERKAMRSERGRRRVHEKNTNNGRI